MMSLNPEDLGLPVPTWRQHQYETVTKALLSDKPVVLIQAPPGSGKSVIALSLARLSQSRTHFLTGTKQLQTQYSDLGPFKVLGRNNFPCLIQPSVQADRAMCTVGIECEYKGDSGMPGCGYYDQKRKAAVEPEVVWNYAFWLAQMNYGHWRNKPDLLILDEAHTVREHVRSFASITVRVGATQLAAIPWCRVENFHAAQAWAEAWVKQVHNRAKGAIDEREIRTLEALEQSMLAMIRAKDDWVIEETDSKITFRPVWPDELMNQYVYKHVAPQGKIVFLSATILNPDAFCRLNGLKREDVEYLDVPSTFPVRNRPIRYWNQGKVSAKTGYDAVAEAVETIMSMEPERGIIHTVSYALAEAIESGLSRANGRRIVVPKAQNREYMLEYFRKTPGCVLLTPSMHTGVDLPYDLLRWQVITKIPFPDLRDAQIKAAMKEVPCPAYEGELHADDCPVCRGKGVITDRRGQLAYNYQTVATLVQTYGRIVRAIDDYGRTYLLDGNYSGWFRPAMKDLLPTFFTEAVKAWSPPEVNVDDLIAESLAKIPGGKRV